MMASSAVLITGASGFLGYTIAGGLADRGYRITGTYANGTPDAGTAWNWQRLLLERDESLQEVAGLRPDCIVHCAALARRDLCEQRPELATLINVRATGMLADMAGRWDIPMVYISTDLVFDGGSAPYSEDAPVAPASVYAKTKADGEDAVRHSCRRHYIIRPALMYGAFRGAAGSFLSWTTAALREGRPLQLYVNQFRTVLYAPDVTELIHRLLRREAPYGTYHAAGPERLHRHDIGCRIADAMGAPNDLLQAARLERPMAAGDIDDTSLCTAKAERETGIRFTPLRDGLQQLRDVLRVEEEHDDCNEHEEHEGNERNTGNEGN